MSLLDRGDAPLSDDDVAALVRSAPPSYLDPDVAEVLLALADDELVVGHRHSEWLGLCPFLEEDLTMASLGQEELGHARALYALVWPDWPGRDGGVARRPASEWRSGPLAEAEPEPWERHFVRHLLHDTAEPFRWEALLRYDISGLAGVVGRVLEEERFHERHAVALANRLGRGTSEANTRLQRQLDDLWPSAVNSFTGPDATRQSAAWLAHIRPILADCALREPAPVRVEPADRRRRSAPFASAHAAMLAVVAADPNASW